MKVLFTLCQVCTSWRNGNIDRKCMKKFILFLILLITSESTSTEKNSGQRPTCHPFFHFLFLGRLFRKYNKTYYINNRYILETYRRKADFVQNYVVSQSPCPALAKLSLQKNLFHWGAVHRRRLPKGDECMVIL